MPEHQVTGYSAMRQELTKIARTTAFRRLLSSRRFRESLVSQAVPTQRSAEELRKLKRRRKARKDREKRAYGASDRGFLAEPQGSLPTTPLDTEGKLRTNDEPTSPSPRKLKFQVKSNLQEEKVKPKPKRRAVPLPATDTHRFGDYAGAEPLGVDRSFHENHENRTAG